MRQTPYIQSFEKWKAAETDDLKANWLPFVGLFWLKPGVNAFGSDPSNAIVFPKGPAHAGEFDLDGKDVPLKLRPQTQASVDGKRVTGAKLEPDTSIIKPRSSEDTARSYHRSRTARWNPTKRLGTVNTRGCLRVCSFSRLTMDYRQTAKWLPRDGKKVVPFTFVLTRNL